LEKVEQYKGNDECNGSKKDFTDIAQPQYSKNICEFRFKCVQFIFYLNLPPKILMS
jgi:hypothetical protein